MTTKRLQFFFLSAALVVPLLFITLIHAWAADEDGTDDSFIKYLSVFTEVFRLVEEVYVEEPDIGELMAGALDGTADALDPFSVYVPADQLDFFLEARAVGAGHSGLVVVRERGVAYVVSVEEGSPAAAAGFQRGDVVSKLQGRSSRNMPLWEIQGVLAGEPGTRIEVEIVQRGTTSEVAFDLAAYTAPPPRLEESRGVGVLRIPSFSSKTAAEVDRVLKRHQGDKLVVDLRGVAGGEPALGYQVAELFAAGELGVLLANKGPVESFQASRPGPWQGEVAVLIDRGSQGPAEILAAVLGQSVQAKILGEQSFGHAGRLHLVKLSSGAALQITDSFYTGPDQKPLNEGVTPHIVVHAMPRTDDEEWEDRILDRALDLLLEEGEEAAGRKAA